MASKTSRIVLIVALGLLMGAPLISYLYLKKGYDYRLESLHVLADKGEISPFNLVIDSLSSLNEEDLKGFVTVVALNRGDGDETAFLDDLFDQYKEREEFRILSFVDSGETLVIDSRYIRIKSAPTTSRQFFRNTFTDSIAWREPAYVLLDTSAHIRKVYPGDEENETIKLVEHIAIVLPRTKKSDIIHKRSIDEE